jgi:molybdate transport system substrate-binding protein
MRLRVLSAGAAQGVVNALAGEFRIDGTFGAVGAIQEKLLAGAPAMRELAGISGGYPIGVTQITEILNTPGVTLVGPLPREFELATVCTAAVGARATAPEAALRLVTRLAGEALRPLRETAGSDR